MNKLYNFLIFLLVLIGVCLIWQSLKIKENYTNLQPASFPKSVDKPILDDYYKEKQNPKLSTQSYGEMSKSYPRFPANSLTNNNIRQWGLPDNGTCYYSELCDAFYKPNKVNCDLENMWTWLKNNQSSKRVNFY